MVKWAYKPKNKENLIGKTVLICMIVMTLLCPTIMETMGSSEGVENLEGSKTTKSLDSLYNPEWQYRKPITITENSNSDLTDYQVLIEVDTASLVSEGKMQNDGDDIRFTDQDGNELSYWIEHFDNLKYNEPDDYVASWDMDEGTGNTIYDNSSNNNDGTIYGASWTTGINGSALNFDGINDYVSVPDSPSLSPTQMISVEAWIKPSYDFHTSSNKYEHIISKEDGTGDGYNLAYLNGNIFFQLGNGGWGGTVSGKANLYASTWYHLVGTYDKTNVRLYLNGIQLGNTSWASTFTDVSNALWIGKGWWNDNIYFSGIIDEVRIYDRALSSDEIKSIYEEKSKLWVKVPSIPANGETTIYMYYGNPSVSSASDGNSTFEFFDSFDRADSDTIGNGWTENYDIASIEDNRLKVSNPGGGDYYNAVSKDYTATNDVVIEVETEGLSEDWTGDGPYHMYFIFCGPETEKICGFTLSVYYDAIHCYSTDGLDTGISYEANLPYHLKMIYHLSEGLVDYYIDETLIALNVTPGTNLHGTSPINKIFFGAKEFTGYFDNIKIRKYASPEPTIIIGLEEEISLDFWYDTFIDTSKIDCMENVTVENGDVKLAPGEFIVDEHTVALWHFNEGSGTTAYDETPNDNDGTINGATWTNGKFSSALSFDGDGDYVEIPDSDSFNMVSWTIEAWIKIPYTGNEGRKIIVIQHEGSSQKYWYMALSSNNLELGYCLGVGDPYCIVESYNQPLNDGVWHHVAGVKSGGNYLKWYIDGINVKTLNITDNRTYALSTDVWIGGFWWVDDQYFNGTIDEIRISNIARTKFDYYQTFGTLTSEKIHVPTNKTWNTLYINKTEPQNTHLKVSVLDGENNQTITEYENMNQTTISLSGINPVEHPTIRLKADFIGNGTATPLLHYWSVNWTNISGDVDLTLNSSDISFSEMDEDGNITINALIHNTGNNTAQNIGVRFLINSLQIGNDQTIDSIPGNSSENTNTVWTPMNTGTHTITITIDPNNLIPETNETNNNANKNIDVPAYYSVELNLLSNPTQSINSGESATYAIAVHNLGNTNDTVNLGITGKTAGWNAELNTNSIFLTSKTYQYNSTTIALTVTAPSDADINEVATITVTGTSHGNNQIKDEITTVTIANPTNNIFLTCINNNTHHINPDTTTTYTLLLINYGNETETDNINIDYSESAAGWIVELKQNNIPLGYENYTTVNLTVTSPENASAHVNYQITVTATSTLNPALYNTTTITTIINPVYSINITVPNTNLNINPAEEINITITIQNTGNTQNIISTIIMNRPAGWNITLEEENLLLNQSQKKNITLSIKTPEYTPAGNYTITINITTSGKNYQIIINVTVKKQYKVEITAPEIKYALPNKETPIPFTIKNTGNINDTVNIVVNSSGNWQTTLTFNGTETTNISIEPNSTAELVLNTLTGNKTGNYNITITCTSIGNNSIETKTVIVKVELPDIKIMSVNYPENIKQNSIIPVTAVIRNTGNVSAENVVAQLYIDGKQTGYSNNFNLIPVDSEVFATFYWKPKTEGKHSIKVVVSSEYGTEDEYSEEVDVEAVSGSEMIDSLTVAVVMVIVTAVLLVISFILYTKRMKTKKTSAAVMTPVTSQQQPVEGMIHIKPIEETNIPLAAKMVDGYLCPLCNKKFMFTPKEEYAQIRCPWCNKGIGVKK